MLTVDSSVSTSSRFYFALFGVNELNRDLSSINSYYDLLNGPFMNQTIKSPVILIALAGLGSALLSVTVNSVHFELLSVGFAFGAALAGYFVVYEGYRNWVILISR